jgi:hypothetical protein
MPTSWYLIFLPSKIFGKEYKLWAFRYTVLSTTLSPLLSKVQIFCATTCSQKCITYTPHLEWKTKFHTHMKQQNNNNYYRFVWHILRLWLKRRVEAMVGRHEHVQNKQWWPSIDGQSSILGAREAAKNPSNLKTSMSHRISDFQTRHCSVTNGITGASNMQGSIIWPSKTNTKLTSQK